MVMFKARFVAAHSAPQPAAQATTTQREGPDTPGPRDKPEASATVADARKRSASATPSERPAAD